MSPLKRPRLIKFVVASVALLLAASVKPSVAEDFSDVFQHQKDLESRTLATQLFRQGNQQSKNRQFAAALDSYKKVLAICQQMQDFGCLGNATHQIGNAYFGLEQYPQAVEAYWQAVMMSQRQGDRLLEADILNDLGNTYQKIGQFDEALDVTQQALLIYRQEGNREGEGRSLNNIGAIHQSLSKYSQALDFFQQAVDVYQTIGDQSSVASVADVTSNIGLVYSYLGEYPKALNLFHQALVIQETLNNLAGQAATLQFIGLVYRRQKQESEAIRFYQRALTIRRDLNDQAGVAEVLNNLGVAYEQLGQYPQALQALEEALTLAQTLGAREHEGNILDVLATVYKDLEQYSEAMELYQQSLQIERDVGNRASERITLGNIGDLFKQQNQPELAIVFYKQSVNLTETIRQELRVLPLQQQESYTKSVADSYRQLADLLLQENRVLEAQQVLDLLKVQELDEYLRNVRGTEATAQGVPNRLPEQQIQNSYNQLIDRAIPLGQELTQLAAIPVDQRTSEQQHRVLQLRQQQQQLTQEFTAFFNRPEIKANVDQLRQNTGGQSLDLANFKNLQDNLRNLHQDAILLYPLVLDDRLELVLVTPDAPPIHRASAVTRAALTAAINTFLSALKNPNSDAVTPAQQLYSWLIRPIENDLAQAGAKTIIYAPDGALRYIPLAALHDGTQWLVQRFRINNITATSLTELNSVPYRNPQVFAGAFTQGTYQVSIGDRQMSFQGLPFARQEVETLAALIPGITQRLNRDFNPNTVLEMDDYNIVHLATHATFVPTNPTNSFILFGDGTPIRLRGDRSVESWHFNNVDLIVLSACETGVGELGNGVEILGFGYLMQNAGARAAIASLWAVDDGGTQALMDAFYAALRGGNATKAEALRQAQIALITGNFEALENSSRGIVGVRQRIQNGVPRTVVNRLSHPYYWAPFILIGNGL